ncbi:uncharacterized protein KD926_008347 [Aspergillus affinis]|uniref:uncharacterized protein n=1 Tax=Aspergillus affinis TaxID=1070780 RepID=UPI0022FE4418|nr:uncharacterized protein KD926_008347 [Aspergillus affinis]KAI9040390.1 hypothetical protein KD926_008347 [Aspergillus affinis]
MNGLVFNRGLTPKAVVPIICEVLDNSLIPNVLVGDAMLGIMGAPIFPRCLQFIVPDEHIDAAIKVLESAGFPRCNDLNGCRRYSTHFPLAPAHFHLWDDEDAGTTDPGKLCIFPKSEMLWSFPSFPFYVSDTDDPYFMTITDERLPDQPNEKELFGRYPADTYPVRIPVPIKACEAAMLLYCRDQELKLNNAAWEVWLTKLGQYVSQTDLYQIGRTIDKDGKEECPYAGFWNEVKGSQNRYWPKYLWKLRIKILQRRGEPILPELQWPGLPGEDKEKEERKEAEARLSPLRKFFAFDRCIM